MPADTANPPQFDLAWLSLSWYPQNPARHLGGFLIMIGSWELVFWARAHTPAPPPAPASPPVLRQAQLADLELGRDGRRVRQTGSGQLLRKPRHTRLAHHLRESEREIGCMSGRRGRV